MGHSRNHSLCELEPIPGVKISKAVEFVGNNVLSSGSFDQLYEDKTSRSWRTWLYFKSKKKIPEISTNAYGNQALIELLEKAAISEAAGHRNVSEEYFIKAMEETTKQFGNPRSDSAEALDRLGQVCMKANDVSKAITCFEYSLHMRKLVYGKDAVHVNIVRSLFLLANAWSAFENYHRAIIVYEKALSNARALSKSEYDHEWTVHLAEIYHNMATCWERLHEHRPALECYDKAQRLRRLAITPDVSLRRRAARRIDQTVNLW